MKEGGKGFLGAVGERGDDVRCFDADFDLVCRGLGVWVRVV